MTASAAPATPAAVKLPHGLAPGEKDYVTAPGQHFVAVSFVGPHLPQKHERLAMKIRGAFSTLEEAEAHVRRLHAAGDTAVDTLVYAMNEWHLAPEVPKAEDDDAELRNVLMGYHAAMQEAKKAFEKRKEAVMRDGVDAHLTEEERLPPPKPEDVEKLKPSRF